MMIITFFASLPSWLKVSLFILAVLFFGSVALALLAYVLEWTAWFFRIIARVIDWLGLGRGLLTVSEVVHG